MISLSMDQLAAYAGAVYEVEVGGAWRDALGYAYACDDGPSTLISACNPWSQRLHDAENARRHQELQRQIEVSRNPWVRARGRSSDGSWMEPGFLVQAPMDRVDGWARAWQQHAVLVVGAPGRAPELRLYSPFAGTDPPQQLANMRLEWVGCGPPVSP